MARKGDRLKAKFSDFEPKVDNALLKLASNPYFGVVIVEHQKCVRENRGCYRHQP